LISGKYSDKVDEFQLIDCRYPFEYNGGHIKGAKNITTIDVIESLYFKTPPVKNKRVVIVFHCEYSIQRAPQMYVLLMQGSSFSFS
jgi:rhodanese-related sulfurtransferase